MNDFIDKYGNGLKTTKSAHDFAKTVSTLKATIENEKVPVDFFTVIDHLESAKTSDAPDKDKMLPSTVILFGNRERATQKILEFPMMALDLPQRMLVHEDADGNVYVTHNTGDYMRLAVSLRHGDDVDTEQYDKLLGAIAGAVAAT